MEKIDNYLTLDDIKNVSLQDDEVKNIFSKVLSKYTDNPETILNIFDKVVTQEGISEEERKIIFWLGWFSFYRELFKEINKVEFSDSIENIRKLSILLSEKIRILFKEFEMNTVLSRINNEVSDTLNPVVNISDKKYIKLQDNTHCEIIQDYWDYKVVKRLGDDSYYNNMLINSKWEIIISWKKLIRKPIKIWGKTYCKHENTDWYWLSDISEWEEKILLRWKKWLWNPIEKWGMILCPFRYRGWTWLSDISEWKEEVLSRF